MLGDGGPGGWSPGGETHFWFFVKCLYDLFILIKHQQIKLLISILRFCFVVLNKSEFIYALYEKIIVSVTRGHSLCEIF